MKSFLILLVCFFAVIAAIIGVKAFLILFGLAAIAVFIILCAKVVSFFS